MTVTNEYFSIGLLILGNIVTGNLCRSMRRDCCQLADEFSIDTAPFSKADTIGEDLEIEWGDFATNPCWPEAKDYNTSDSGDFGLDSVFDSYGLFSLEKNEDVMTNFTLTV